MNQNHKDASPVRSVVVNVEGKGYEDIRRTALRLGADYFSRGSERSIAEVAARLTVLPFIAESEDVVMDGTGVGRVLSWSAQVTVEVEWW